ncbi:Mur ligase domain-containing protein [Lentisphaerota bacterium WC36G]|nr:Mur ligase domain-containing protein [Lentisphaerae bacterium WC36]
MKLNSFKKIHFIGCGGAGMFPLAAIMQQRGFEVSGSDLNSNEKTTKLSSLGVNVFIGHNETNLPKVNDKNEILVVFSSAVNKQNIEFKLAKELNYIMLRRGEFLALMASTYQNVISVSGSHGKTSITAMTVFLFNYFKINASWVIGGEVVDSITSFNCANDNNIFITEVDESDGTHTFINSSIALIPNIEDDHSWSVGGSKALMKNFKKYANQATKIFTIKNKYPKGFWNNFCGNLNVLNAINNIDNAKKYQFGAEIINSWGFYQMENALLAAYAVNEFGVCIKDAIKALENFSGIKRRAIKHFQSDKLTIIEDYAHHPTEVHSIVSTVKRCNPNKEIWIIFQPHRYARLEKYLNEFAKELSCANRVFIAEVFAAWVEKNDVDSSTLCKLITVPSENITINFDLESKKIIQKIDKSDNEKIILILGAGDIDKLLNKILEHYQK